MKQTGSTVGDVHRAAGMPTVLGPTAGGALESSPKMDGPRLSARWPGSQTALGPSATGKDSSAGDSEPVRNPHAALIAQRSHWRWRTCALGADENPVDEPPEPTWNGKFLVSATCKALTDMRTAGT